MVLWEGESAQSITSLLSCSHSTGLKQLTGGQQHHQNWFSSLMCGLGPGASSQQRERERPVTVTVTSLIFTLTFTLLLTVSSQCWSKIKYN